MKKLNIILFLFTVLLSGCSKEEQALDIQYQKDKDTFYATFGDTQTRTYVEQDVNQYWTNGDEISLFTSTTNQSYIFKGTTGSKYATFEKNHKENIRPSFSTIYALYPYNSSTTISNDCATIVYEFPAIQKYSPDSFGPGANTMYATSNINDNTLSFRNLCGFIRFKLYGDATIRSIELKGNKGELIAGKSEKYTYNISRGWFTDGSTSITLDCGENGVKLGTTEQTATAFWFVVPPVVFNKGFSIDITTTDGPVITKTTLKYYEVNRNELKTMAALDVNKIKRPTNEIRYTSTNNYGINLQHTEAFGANFVSHIYDNDLGIIRFDNDITAIPIDAFQNCTTLKTITLPESVTFIAKKSFLGCSNLESINIPEGIVTIREYTFENCAKLQSIIIPSTVKTIEKMSFNGCSNLQSAIIPEGVTDIQQYAFYNCAKLQSITIPNTVKTINMYTFAGCSSLQSINLHGYLTSIGEYAFNNCSSLQSINLQYNLKTIGSRALMGCSSLQSINIPSGVTTIEAYTFADCSNLQSIKLHGYLTSIGEYAFKGCSSLQSINIPSSVKTINNYTFADCSNLQSINLHKDVTYIGESAFKNCSSLQSIDIPDGVGDIKNGAFQGCSMLESIKLPRELYNIEPFTFAGCSNLQSIDIPIDSWYIRYIGGQAFDGCSSLKSIVIPYSVERVDNAAFANCPNLLDIYCYPTDPPYPGGLRSSVEEAKIHVHSTCLSAYKENTHWGTLINKLVGDLDAE